MSQQKVCSGCGKPRPNVVECSVRISTKSVTFLLCERHRAPIVKMMDAIPGVKARARNRNTLIVPVKIEDIPRIQPAKRARKTV